MSKRRNVLTSLILYRDKSFRIVECENLHTVDLSNREIAAIFIPNLEAPNSYIPIKPSEYYKFHKCVVDIIYQGFTTGGFESEAYVPEDADSDFSPKEYHEVCYDLVEFINAIYNLWKFRGTSIFLTQNCDSECMEGNDSLVIFPRYYQIKFYNEKGKMIETISSGELESIAHKYIDRTDDTPIEFCQEEFMESLNEIFFTPLCTEKYKNDKGSLGTLPLTIWLSDRTWVKVNRPSRVDKLFSYDYVLVLIEDYGIYYYIQYGAYLNMLKIQGNLQIYAGNYALPHDIPIMPSLDKKKVPSLKEKLDAVDAFTTGHYYPTFSILTDINTPNVVITIILFLRHIMSSIHYLMYDIFQEMSQEEIDNNPNEGVRVRLLAIFNPDKQVANTSNRILTELELSDEKIQDAILSLIKEEM